MNSTQAVCTRFIDAAHIDYVGFWEIVHAVSKEHPDKSKDEKFLVVLDVVKCLVANGIRAFNFDPLTKERILWDDASAEETLSRIEQEWRALGREPSGQNLTLGARA